MLVRIIFCLCLLVGAASQAAEKAEKSKDNAGQELSVIFVGDIMLDNGPGHVIASGKDPFEPCREVLANADFTIGNLECVLGRGGEQILKNYVFRAAKGSPPILKKHFSAVSLANNHTGDFGIEGLTEALGILEKEKLPYFGAGKNDKEARAPLILEKHGLKVALLGYNEHNADYYAATDKQPGNAPLREELILADIRAAAKQADFVIPFLHWGSELTGAPHKEQKQLARKMIDAGATAIVGAHPHVTQTVEVYRGAPLVYSLGNFVFDYYPVDPPEWTGWIVKFKLRKGEAVDFEMEGVELGKDGVPKVIK